MPKKKKKRVSAVCSMAGRGTQKGSSYSAGTLSKCGWRKKGAKAQRSSAMKKAWNTSPKLRLKKVRARLKRK